MDKIKSFLRSLFTANPRPIDDLGTAMFWSIFGPFIYVAIAVIMLMLVWVHTK